VRVARLVRGPRNFLVWGSLSTKYDYSYSYSYNYLQFTEGAMNTGKCRVVVDYRMLVVLLSTSLLRLYQWMAIPNSKPSLPAFLHAAKDVPNTPQMRRGTGLGPVSVLLSRGAWRDRYRTKKNCRGNGGNRSSSSTGIVRYLVVA